MNKLSHVSPFVIGALAVMAAVPVTATPVKKHSTVYTKGTKQMPGGYGAFGTTYTLNNNGSPINFTLLSAEYSIEPFNYDQGTSPTADADHKFLIFHYRLKNPTTGDAYYSSGNFYQAVDSNNNTITDTELQRRSSEKQGLSVTMKPGQGIDDLVACVRVPAHGAIAKLIISWGEFGTKDQVFRYTLGPVPNIVKPLPAPYVDTADKSGATSLDEIPATVGTSYVCGNSKISVDNIELVPGPFADHTAPDGKQFLVATVTMTNIAWAKWYHPNNQILPTVTTDDDKITDYFVLKAKHDEDYADATLENGDSTTQRLVVTVDAKDPGLKKLSVLFDMGDDGKARPLVYDLSGVK